MNPSKMLPTVWYELRTELKKFSLHYDRTFHHGGIDVVIAMPAMYNGSLSWICFKRLSQKLLVASVVINLIAYSKRCVEC